MASSHFLCHATGSSTSDLARAVYEATAKCQHARWAEFEAMERSRAHCIGRSHAARPGYSGQVWHASALPLKAAACLFSHISIKILFSISLLCELMHGIPYIVQLIKAHHQFLCCARVHHFKKRLSCFSGTVRWLIRSGNAGVPLYLVI